MIPGLILGLVPLDVPIDIGRDEAQRRAVEELTKAKYGGTPGWLDSGGRRFEHWLQYLVDLWTRYTLGRGTGGGVNVGLILVAVVVLAVIALAIWRFGVPRLRRAAAADDLELDPTRLAADYRTQADAAAAAGDWAAAVRDRFRGIVRELETRTILDVRPARTASEAAFTASRLLPGCAEHLRRGAELFNGVVYGDQRADAAAYATVVAADAAVLAAADAADLVDSEPIDEPTGVRR